MLYQLSYFRIFFQILREENETRTHTTQRSLPPQSSASTNSAISPFLFSKSNSRLVLCPEQDSNLHVSQHSHLKRARLPFRHLGIYRLLPLSGKRGSNSRPQPWQGCALPTELFPHVKHESVFYKLKSNFQRERKTRLELATPTLARLCSTN